MKMQPRFFFLAEFRIPPLDLQRKQRGLASRSTTDYGSFSRSIIMNSISHLFAPIMVIGTIMALIFAAGALWNSISRRRLLMEAERDEAEDDIKFTPPPSSPLKPPTEVSVPPPEPEKKKSGALFRQIGTAGVVQAKSAAGEHDLYVWE